MNFLNFFNIQVLIFLQFLPLVVVSQQLESTKEFSVEPLTYKIASLPSGYFSSFDSFITANEYNFMVAAANKIWIFDGQNWQSISFPAKPIHTTSPSGQTFIAYNNQIERIEFSPKGFITKQVVLDSSDARNVGNIQAITSSTDSCLFFITPKGLWRLNNKLTLIDSLQGTKKNLGDFGKDLVFQSKSGISSIGNNHGFSNLLSENAVMTDENLLKVVNLNGCKVAIGRNYPWIIPITSGESKRPFEITSYIGSSKSQIRKVYQKNGYLYLLTDSNKIVIICEKSLRVTAFTVGSYSKYDDIIDILPYSNQNILILSQSAVFSCINTNYAGGIFTNGKFEPAPSMVTIDGYCFFASNGWIYRFDVSQLISSPAVIEKYCWVNESVKEIYSFKSQLYAICHSGVFQVHKLYSKLLYPLAPTFQSDLKFLELNGELWLVSKGDKNIIANCLTSTLKSEITFSLPSNYQGINQMVAFEGFVLAQTLMDKWFIADLSNPKIAWEEVHLDIKQSNINFSLGSKKRPFVYEDDCLYRYNHTQNLKGEIVSSDTSNYIIPVVDLDSLLIVKRIVKPFTDFYSLWIYRRQAAGLPFIPVKPIATIESSEVIKSALYTSDSTLILITYSGMYYYRSTELGYAKPTVSFQRVSLSSSSGLHLLHDGFIKSYSPLSKPKQQANCRNLRAIFSSNSSGDWRAGQNSVQFSSFLTGYDSNWSPWSSNNIRETNRLYPGKYTLSVKSRNFLGNESPVVFINFYVAPRFFEIPYFIVSFAFLGLLGLFLLYRWRGYSHAKVRFKLESLINTRTEELVKEKEKTDNLLARVLPKETATELKEKGRVNTQRFQVVTVLFCDIEGFTKITEETNPEVLIDQLDRFFLYFDSVVEKYRIEKIKTIGDAYMCAGGIPKKNRTNPVEVVLAALEMIQYMRDIVSQSELMQKVWDLRIGIDTGPVIAGVVGRNKLSYDIWGSTVNTASRMESSGEKGQINISGNTYMLVSDYFTCTYRGKMPVKNKGDIEMYFVDGIKPSLSIGFIGLEPNDKFQVQLQMIRLGDLEDFILEKLADGLPQNLYYHNLKHTIDVYTQVELIGRAENVTLEELLLLRTAALFHDAGHLIDYDTHEEMAVKLVREILPDFQYTERQIEIISSLIMSTKMPPKPMNLLEEIICDADLDYLGRTDFIPVSNELYRELHEHGKVGTLHEWNELQIRFIDKHSYFTKTARKLRNVNKQSQLDKLKEWMEKN